MLKRPRRIRDFTRSENLPEMEYFPPPVRVDAHVTFRRVSRILAPCST